MSLGSLLQYKQHVSIFGICFRFICREFFNVLVDRLPVKITCYNGLFLLYWD